MRDRPQKIKMYTRRQRHRARLAAKADDKVGRLEAKANARAFGKRYAVFFGCDPERTEALADADRFRPEFMEGLDG